MHKISRSTVILIVVAVLVIVAIVIGLSHKTYQPSGPLVVGVSLPLSGQYAVLGEGVQKAMELSVANLKEKNVKLIFEDDAYDAKTVLSAYHKLMDVDHADVIVTFGSPAVEAVKPLVNATNTIMLILGDELSHDADHVFEIMPQAAGLYNILAQQAAARFHSIGIVRATDDSLYMRGADIFAAALPKSVAVSDLPVASTSDIKAEAAKIIQAKTEAFTMFVPIETGIKLLKQISKTASSTRPRLICDPNIELAADQYVSAVGADLFNGCVSVIMTDTMTDAFRDMYMKAYQTLAYFGTDLGYDAVGILSRLADMPASDRLDYLNESFKYKGVSGMITFDKTGTRPPLAEVHMFKDGHFVKLEQVVR